MANSKPSVLSILWFLRPSGRRTYADGESGWWLADPIPKVLAMNKRWIQSLVHWSGWFPCERWMLETFLSGFTLFQCGTSYLDLYLLMALHFTMRRMVCPTKADKAGEFVQENNCHANPFHPQLCFSLRFGCWISANAERLSVSEQFLNNPWI